MYDSNDNEIITQTTSQTYDGLPIVVVYLADEPTTGYIALDEGTGGFGTAYPSSYGMPCLTWFGEGERFPDAQTALNALADAVS